VAHSRFAAIFSIETIHMVRPYGHPSMNILEICPPLASYHALIYRSIAVLTNVSALETESINVNDSVQLTESGHSND